VDIEEAYKNLADFTQPQCATVCRIPFSCCSPEYCDSTIDYARTEYGVTLVPTSHERLPLMGEKGCIAAPHLRPMCTFHTCDIGSLGFHRTDPKWTKMYFKKRSVVEKLENKRWMEKELK
jgi:hypothetical protein